MVLRQEEMRRKTAEYEAELRTKTELAKARAEADGRIRQERENHDLILEKRRSLRRHDALLLLGEEELLEERRGVGIGSHDGWIVLLLVLMDD